MDVCVCGHALDQHGGDPVYPGSMACHGVVQSEHVGQDEECDCIHYEEDDSEDE